MNKMYTKKSKCRGAQGHKQCMSCVRLDGKYKGGDRLINISIMSGLCNAYLSKKMLDSLEATV